MPINTGIPNNLILPLAHFCVDTDRSPVVRPCCPALFMAPMLDIGTAEPDVRYPIATCEQAQELFGEGSIAADMACYYLLNNRFGELYVVGLSDPGLPKADGTIQITSPASEAGTFYVRIGDHSYNVPVFASDSRSDIASALAELIQADTDAPFTAELTDFGAGVIVTAKNGGEQGNTIPICVNNLFGEELPRGMEYSIGEFNGGGGTYPLETAISNLGECCYDFFGIPFCDTNSHVEMEQELISRWQCDRLIGGRWYASCCKNFTEHMEYLDNANYQFGSIITCCPNECYIPWRETAAYVGRTHLQTCIDPTQAWYGLELLGIRCSSEACDDECFERAERNLLSLNGGSVNTCGPRGNKIIELETSVGANSLFDVWRYPQSAYQTTRFLRQLSNFVEERFRGVRIVDDIENVEDGTSAVTPTMIVSIIKVWAEETQSDILDNVANLDNFIQIERNPENPFRIDMCINIDLANALRVLAIKIKPTLTTSFGALGETEAPASTI